MKGLIKALAFKDAKQDDEGAIRRAAASALGELGDARAVEPLIVLLRHESTAARESAAAWESEAKRDPAAWRDQEPVRESAALRAAAAEALGRLGDVRAVEPLIAALADAAEWGTDYVGWVRAEALTALGRLGDKRAVASLIPCLRDKDEKVSKGAADALQALGWTPGDDEERAWFKLAYSLWDDVRACGDAAIEPLRTVVGWPAVFEDQKRRRVHAAATLVEMKSPSGLEALLDILRTSDSYASTAASALDRLDASLERGTDAWAVEPLITALRRGCSGCAWPNAQESSHARTLRMLGKLGDPRATDALVYDLSKGDLPWLAADALAQIGGARAVTALLDLLDFRAAGTRACAAKALGLIGDTRAVEPLLGLLRDESPPVQGAAAMALGRLGDVHAIEPIIEAMGRLYQQNPEAIDRTSQRRIDEIRRKYHERYGGEASDRPVGFSSEEDAGAVNDMDAALLALAEHKDPRAAELLLAAALGGGVWGVRTSAVRALDRLDWAPEDPVQRMRYAVARRRWDDAVSLARLGDERVLEPLVAVLKDDDDAMRRAAAAALDTLGWTPGDNGDDVLAAWYAVARGRWDDVERLGAAALDPLVAELRDVRADFHIYGDLFNKSQVGPALVKLGAAAVAPLIALLKDRDKYVREKAAEVLARLGDERAMAPLLALTNDGACAWAAVKSLETLLEGHAHAVPPADLQQIAALKAVFQPVIHTTACGDYTNYQTRTEPVDISPLKQLARQELIRRGEALSPPPASPAREPGGNPQPSRTDGDLADQVHARSQRTAEAHDPIHMVDALRDPSEYVRDGTALELRQRADPRTVGPLVALAADPQHAATAVWVLQAILERSAAEVSSEDLLAVVALEHVVQRTHQQDKSVEIATVQQFARQELIRRGLEA